MASTGSTSRELVNPVTPVAQTSKLLTLPVELLEGIFDDVYAAKPIGGPICRALLRFQDKHDQRKFRRVWIIGGSMLSNYCRSLSIRQSVGAACQSFKVTPKYLTPVVDSIPRADVSLLFASIQNVRYMHLKVEQASSAVMPFLPNLAEMTLEAHFVGRPDPYHPSYHKGLGAFPHLASLSLQFVVNEDEFDEVHPGAVTLVSRCPILSTLTISDTTTSLVSAPLITAAAGLGTLKTLELASSTRPPSTWKLPKALKAMKDLEDLEIGAGCTCRDKPSFETLRRIPLKSLSFASDTVVSAAHLLDLISGEAKHTSLASLELNNIQGEYILPKFTKTFSREGLTSIVNAAKAEGISLTGDTLDAPDIEDDIQSNKEQAKGWLEREDRRQRRGYREFGSYDYSRRW